MSSIAGAALRVESELGTSWQAQLVMGALPERMHFPSARAELMFAPPESLPFDVDLSFNARYLPNELALRIARRRIQDADQILRAESDGEQGICDLGYERTQEARDLLAYLQASSRPPLLRATLAIAVSAPSEEELEDASSCAGAPTGRSACIAPSATSSSCSCSIFRGSARESRATTTRSRPSRSQR